MPTTIDQQATYLAAIKNSVGSKQYRQLLADVDGVRMDLADNGRLSCALYVSSVLFHFGWIKGLHATVESTVKDMKEQGWKETSEPKAGDVLVWEATLDHDAVEPHQHIGFYLGDGQAVSNSSKLGEIIQHEWTFGGTRACSVILTR